MTNLIKNEETFIINANIRESYMNRVDVLEKVKGLLLLPNMEMATTKQVAEFYEIEDSVIRHVIKENKEELLQDGYKINVGKDLARELISHAKVERERGHILINGEMRLPYTEVALFPKRAILRVGMLLRDSLVAKEVRTQLLNIEERTSDEIKVADISEEQALQIAVGKALMTGDINGLAYASEKLIEFKNRRITEMENKLQEQQMVIKVLVKEEVQYKNPRTLLRKLVNHYSKAVHGTISTNKGWIDLRQHLVNKLERGINLKSRRTIARKSNPRASYISVIKKEEFNIIIPAMIGICVNSGVNVSDIMKDA
ncbi:hypothetical protein [Bacillus paranthracis]|uniref:hypothetical protein n=1 Tax=Bacillus paranthracis TaxID=2026186 RepID=UPI000778362A|nr:hypothetical protein [Bacillus paranthracis]KXY13844.1 hypothetical protein AT271_27730 [Bacillus cereus]MCC2438131.1 hypothetical protein [Bacillus paranthracis]MDG1603787.1 hypothetical protein [Bacillus paranthracis]